MGIVKGTDQGESSIAVNGVTLHYAVAGEGRPIVLVHGNGEDHHLFDLLMRRLAEAGYRVYAPDSRGHGANERLAEYHYADMAEDMYCFIKKLGLEKPAFYGHSDGGIIGLMLAIHHPDVLGALAVSGANLSPAGLDPSFIREYSDKYEKKPNPLIRLMLEEPDIDPDTLKAISIPVLVTAGENDLVLRTETETISRSIPDADMAILAGEDHESYIGGSEIIGKLLMDFLKRKYS